MKRTKFAAGAVFVGAVAAAIIGGGSASAAPGVQVAAGDTTFGIGDNTSTGAQAFAKPGNTAVAVSILGPSTADASKGGSEKFGEGNNVVTFGSTAVSGPQSSGNNVLVVGGGEADIKGVHNNVLVVGGVKTEVKQPSANDNIVTVCGVQFSGQADHVKVSSGGC
jgi:hypothetical protein